MTYSSATHQHPKGESKERLLKVFLIAFYLWLQGEDEMLDSNEIREVYQGKNTVFTIEP